MLFLLLVFLLISNAVTIRRDKSILFSRIVMKSLLLTSFLTYINLYVYDSVFNPVLLAQLVSVIPILGAFLYFLPYCVANNNIKWSTIIFSAVSTILLVGIIRIQQPIWSYVLNALGLDSFYILPIIFLQVLLATFYTVKRKSSLPSVIYLVFIVLITISIQLVIPDLLPMIVYLSLPVNSLENIKTIVFFTEQNDSISNYDYTSNKNLTLESARKAYTDRQTRVRNRYLYLTENGWPIDSKEYAHHYATLAKMRIEISQLGRWLSHHSNGLGTDNIPKPAKRLESDFHKALNEDVLRPTHEKATEIIDSKFKK